MDLRKGIAPRGAHFACVLFFLLGLIIAVPGAAATLSPAVQKGVTWLTGQVQSNGTLTAENASIALPLQAREETFVTLGLLATAPSALSASIASNTDTNLAYRARRIIAAGSNGQSAGADVAALLAQQNADGGWGIATGYQSNALDTAFALQALYAVHSTSSASLTNALTYLSQSKLADGGYGVSLQSTVFVSANALIAAGEWASQYPAGSTVAAAARDWLLAQRDATQKFSSVLDNAVALRALATQTSQGSTLQPIADALGVAQLADGSWADDPYQTALALNALWFASQPSTTPSTGDVHGKVVDQASGAALAGATVQFVGTSGSTSTGSDGGFVLAGVAPGAYTLRVSMLGYQDKSVGIQVAAGQVLNLGSIALVAAPLTATLSGVVKDNYGNPMQNATVAVGTTSALTNASGAYQLSNLSPGTATITASSNGYQTATVNATFVAGTSYLFSPTLYPVNVTPPPTSLQGSVVDGGTGLPIAGASVVSGGVTKTTDAAGKFAFSNIATGAFSLTITANTYQAVTASGTLVSGVNDIGKIPLSKAPQTSTLTGIVTDADTNAPIAAAVISVQGLATTASTDANGKYTLAGIDGTRLTVLANASGYLSQSFNVALPQVGTATFDMQLTKPGASGISFTSIAMSHPSYPPQDVAELNTELANATANAASLVVAADVIDAQHNVVFQFKGNVRGFGQNPPNLPVIVPAGGELEVEMKQPMLRQAAGTYAVHVTAVDPNGLVVAQGDTQYSIVAEPWLAGGLIPDPPLAQIGTNQPIKLSADLTNSGNQTLAAGNLDVRVVLQNADTQSTSAAQTTTRSVASGTPLNNSYGLVSDSAGNLYTVNFYDGKVIKIDKNGLTSVVATLPSSSGGFDLAIDAQSNLYIAGYNAVYKVTQQGAITAIPIPSLNNITGIDIAANGDMLMSGIGQFEQRLVRRTAQGVETVLWRNGLSTPQAMVKDDAGNYVVTNYSDDSLVKVSASTGAMTPFVSGLHRPVGITRDAQGNFYVANYGDSTIAKVSATGQVSTYASGFSQPIDLKFDASGNLFVSNQGNSTISKILPNGTVQVFAQGIANGPQGMKYDSAGNLWIANDDGTLRKKDPQDVVTIATSALSGPKGLAIDAGDNVLVANYSSGVVSKVSGTTMTTFASGLNGPWGVATNNTGDVYVTEHGANKISHFNAAGGTLPAVQSFLYYPNQSRLGPNGEVYVQNYDGSITVVENGVPRILTTGIGFNYFAVDPVNGGVVASTAYDVYRIASNGTVTHVNTASNPFYIYGIGVDAGGNILLIDYYNRKLQRMSAGGALTPFATLPDYSQVLLTDSLGGVFVRTTSNVLYSVDASGTATAVPITLNEYMYSFGNSADGKLLTWTNYSRVYEIDPVTGAATLLMSNPGSVNSGVRDSAGNIYIVDYYGQELRTYASDGTLASALDGFSNPSDIVWTGTDFRFTDAGSRYYAFTPGGYPQKLGYFGANYLAASNGEVYGTSSSIVHWNGSSAETWQSLPNTSFFGGIAARADGALSAAETAASRVVTFDATKHVVNDFGGIVHPEGLAFDAQGLLYVASNGTSTITRFDATGKTPTLFAKEYAPTFLAFDGTNNLFVAHSGGIDKFDVNGTPTTVETTFNTTGLLFDGNQLLALDGNNGQMDKWNGQSFQLFASGLSQVQQLKVAANGDVYLANSGNATVTKYSGGTMSAVASNLPGVVAVNILADGKLYAAGRSGMLYQIGADGTLTDMHVANGVNGFTFGGLTAGTDPNTFYGLASGYNSVGQYQDTVVAITVSAASVVPAPGTVVYQTTVPMADLPAVEGYTHIDLGSWLPPYGGDFRIDLSRAGVGGGATNFVHVGPAANGALSALKPVLPPGDQSEPMCLSLTGADFTSISRVETSQVRPIVNANQPNGMAADRAGNVYFTTYDSLYKTNAQGQTSQVAGSMQLSFGLAADSNENLYVASRNAQSGHFELLRFDPSGSKSTVADLGVAYANGVQVNSKDEVLVGSPGQLLKVNQQGAVSVVTHQGLSSPRGIAVDGKDNVYVQNNGDYVSLIRPDGSVSDIFSRGDGIVDPRFEGDGYPNIAADCSDNFYIATSTWAKLGPNVQMGQEEHTLAQVIARTGQISLLFDAFNINPILGDIDYLAFDRFGNRILMWNHNQGNVWQVPVTCGAIGVQAHLITQPGQTLSGMSMPTSATVPLADGRTEYVWSLKDVTASGAQVCFDTNLKGLTLGETRQTLNSGFFSFQNSFAPNNVQVPLAVPSVHVNNLLQLDVVTDQADYPANATAQVTTTLRNTNPTVVQGALAVNVYDVHGVFVGGVTQQDVSIPALGALPVTQPFAIGAIVPAQYTVKAVLSNNGVDLAKAQTTFNVLPDNVSASATSFVHTDKQTYNPNDQVLIGSRAQSLSANVVLSNLTLMVQVFDPSGAVQFSHGYAIAQLLPNAALDFSAPQTLTNAVSGIYTVKQDLLDDQAHVLSHVEAAYNVASSSDTGFGLTGTIAATPKTLAVGDALTLNASASNHGNGALTNLPLAITLVDAAQGTVLQTFNQTSTIAVGASVPFNTTSTAQGTAGKTYFAVLSATVGSGASAKTLTLAVDTYTLSAPANHLDADVSLSATSPPLAALVLVDANVPASETTRVTSALSALGYVSTFVSKQADFASGVRTGAYQLYLLLATQVSPDATTLRLLREGVHRGEGLLAANGVAGLPDALAQVTGLQTSNALPVINAQALDVLATAPGGPAHTTFTPALASRIVVPQSAQTQATITGRLPSTPDSGALSTVVANLGRADLGYYPTDAGTNNTHLALASVGRIHNANGSDASTVWRIRNSGDTTRSVVLASVSGGYSAALSITAHTDTYIASPIVTGTADHKLSENAAVIQTAAALTTVFTDTRIVDAGDNPGAIALWANAINVSDALDWSGAQHELHGAVHSNSDIRLSGAQNLIDGPVHYVSSFIVSGSQNTFTFQPRQVIAQPMPTLMNLDDYKPGGAVATAVGAQYLDQTAECVKKKTWQRSGSSTTLASGVYWIPCDVHISGSSATGNVTLVSTGSIQIDGSSGTFQSFYQGLQFASTQNGASAIKLSGSSTRVGGLVYAPHGTVEASGSSMNFQCSIIADQIRLAGAKTTIDTRQCAYATVQRKTPAVLWNSFGSGWSAYSAFDWQGAIGQYEAAAPATLSKLFGSVLADIAPSQIVLRSGTVVPLAASVQNKADPFKGQLALQANDNSTFIPSLTNWALDFTSQNTFQAQSNVRLGTGSNTAVTATVSAATPIVVNPLKQKTVAIAHLSGESVGDLVSAVSAIGNRDAGLNNALVALQGAQASLAANDVQGALAHLLDAAEACGQSSNSQADALRTRIDWVIWATTH